MLFFRSLFCLLTGGNHANPAASAVAVLLQDWLFSVLPPESAPEAVDATADAVAAEFTGGTMVGGGKVGKEGWISIPSVRHLGQKMWEFTLLIFPSFYYDRKKAELQIRIDVKLAVLLNQDCTLRNIVIPKALTMWRPYLRTPRGKTWKQTIVSLTLMYRIQLREVFC